MLIGQASINLSANILSAVLGLLSVFVFTRLFSPHDYGIYLLGVGFASVISVFLVGWFRNLILSGHARDDGTDVRGLVISGYFICCLSAPSPTDWDACVGLDPLGGLGRSRAIGRDRPVRAHPGSGSRAADGALGDEGDAGSRSFGTLPGRRRCPSQPERISAAAVVGAGLFARGLGAVASCLAGNNRQIRCFASFGGGQAGPAADAVPYLARRLQRYRPVHDRQSRSAPQRPENMSQASTWSGKP